MTQNTEQPSTGPWSDERGKDGFYKQQRVLRTRLAHDPVLIERTEHEDFLAIQWAARKVVEWADGEWPDQLDAPECIEFLRAGLEGRLRAVRKDAPTGGAGRQAADGND